MVIVHTTRRCRFDGANATLTLYIHYLLTVCRVTEQTKRSSVMCGWSGQSYPLPSWRSRFVMLITIISLSTVQYNVQAYIETPKIRRWKAGVAIQYIESTDSTWMHSNLLTQHQVNITVSRVKCIFQEKNLNFRCKFNACRDTLSWLTVGW